MLVRPCLLMRCLLPIMFWQSWRRTSSGVRTVEVTESGGKASQTACSVRCGPLKLLPCTCADDELALLPPPGWWPRKTLVQAAYPIVDEATDELVCFGP